MINKFKEGQRVKFKNSQTEYRNQVFTVFGYANPGRDEYIYLMDDKRKIITVLDSQLELALEPMNYKGYKTTPEYNRGSDIYFGHIEGIRSYVPWESTSFEGCQPEFEAQVDMYLDFLKDAGISEETGRY